MRKLFSYSAVLALLLTATFAGCRQEPLPETGDTIRFSVSSPTLSVETKADLIDDSNIGAVKLYGSKLSAGATDKVPFFGADGTASSTTLTKSGDAWVYSPIRYWEQGATYDFRAVCPPDANVTATSNSDEIVVSGFSIGSSYDLMVAAKTGVTSAAQAGTAVPLEFKHACSAVRFLFKDGDKNYYIKSFSLSAVTTSGTMTYNAANALPAWGSTSSATYNWPGTSSWDVPADYDETGLEGWYFVVPQDLSDAATLSITYTVGSDGTQVIPVTIPLKGGVGVNTSSVTSWARANAYTYKIQIQANAIDLDVKWGAWLGSDEHEYDLFDPVNMTE